jgi:glyoxylase-like metal-dependent hydrolase (beta-lactamase superfamily II)
MITLPESIRVFERGWLSSNNVLLTDDNCAALVDTGYATHAPQTLALVQQTLGARPLDLIVNTHLHSDHCGGNALLQAAWPCRTLIPESEADNVRDWNEARLTFRATGQICERFTFSGTIAPDARLRLGALDWRVLGAPGHDPHSLMLYCASERILISADALWESGFGVIFPELEGESGFAEQQAVLEAIAKLDVRVVIPGHGAPFTNIEQALERAFSRLAWLRGDPARNAKNALKVLIVFRLLDVRAMRFDELLGLLDDAAVMRAAASMLKPRDEWPGLIADLVSELAANNGPLQLDGARVIARQQ